MTLIDIGCLNATDTNNDFWYQLATTDIKKYLFYIV
jgi:hypothetical protein